MVILIWENLCGNVYRPVLEKNYTGSDIIDRSISYYFLVS